MVTIETEAEVRADGFLVIQVDGRVPAGKYQIVAVLGAPRKETPGEKFVPDLTAFRENIGPAVFYPGNSVVEAREEARS